MSLEDLNNQDRSWTLRNTLTINNNVEVDGDLNTTGFIYDGGVPVNIQTSNNVWTGENTFTNYPPTYIAPINADDMATKNYMDTSLTGLGNSLLSGSNTWTGSNTMDFLPIISNSANANNECVNKNVADTIINASTGNLATANVWTGTNNFQNTLSVPTPLVDADIGNKGYVDNAINAFNSSGGKVEIIESSTTGSVNITCDPNIYSSMIVCMVGAGGYGTNVVGVTGQTIKSFGGSGAYACFKIPAYTGNATYNASLNTRSTIGTSIFTSSTGTILAQVNNGVNGTSTQSGAGGNFGVIVSGVQQVPGSTQTLQNPQQAGIDKVANICVWNGFGLGGSYDFQTGVEVLPTNNYLLLIKFKN